LSNEFLWSYPQNIEQNKFLEKNSILKIKNLSTEILLKFYKNNFFNSFNKQINIDLNNDLVSENFSEQILEVFLIIVNSSYNKNIPDNIISCIYEFFSLILIRRDKKLKNLLEKNIQSIITKYLIINNKMPQRDQFYFFQVTSIR